MRNESRGSVNLFSTKSSSDAW